MTAALVMVSLLRPAGASGLILLHQHCDVDLHVHVSDHNELDSWWTEHVRHDPCEESDGAPGSAQIDTADCCAHDVPIIYLVAFDLTAPSRTGAAKNLSLSPVASVATPPAPTPPSGIVQRARSLGRLRPDLGARSAVSALLLRNHALLL
ncbi:MAG: hypothetical protein ACYS15_03375 [Planctomycetota bacterium]